MGRTRGNNKPNAGQSKRKSKSTSKTTKWKGPQLPKSNPYEQAQRDWEFANEPLLEDIAAEQNRTIDQKNEMWTGYGNIHKGLTHDLGQTPWGKYGQISDQLVNATQGVSNQAYAFGGPASETDAYLNTAASTGNGAQAALAGIQARDVAFTNSVSNQADVDLATRRANLLEATRDTIEKLQEERRNVIEDRGRDIASLTDDYRQRRFENQLSYGAYRQSQKAARSERKATQDLIDYLSSQKGGRGRPGKPGSGSPGKAPNGKGSDTGAHPDTYSNPSKDTNTGTQGPQSGTSSGGGNRSNALDQRIDNQSAAIQNLAAKEYGRKTTFVKKDGMWYAQFYNSYGNPAGEPHLVKDSQLLRLLDARKQNNRKVRRRGNTPSENKDSRTRGKHGRT